MNVSLDPSMLANEQLVGRLENLSQKKVQDKLQAGENQSSKDELKEVANDFEAVLVNFLIKAMWKTIPDSGLYGESKANDAYKDIMQSALSEEVTRLGGLGIAQTIYENMEKSLILEQGKGKE